MKKIDIYKKMLEIFIARKDEGIGLCGAFVVAKNELNLFDVGMLSQKMKKYVPELWDMKPDGASIGEYWWHGKDANSKRVKILNDIINSLSHEEG